MTSNVEHIMERRAALLADAIDHRVNMLADYLTVDRDRPVFSKKLSEPEALAFWQKHRFDEIGMQILANWKPEQIMALDAALAKANGVR